MTAHLPAARPPAVEAGSAAPGVARALAQAAVSQLHPRMLALLVGPFLLAALLWVPLAWLLWQPATAWLRGLVVDGWIVRTLGWSVPAGGWTDWVAPLALLLLAGPLMFATALVLVGVLSMPAVLRFLGARQYADVERRAGALGARALAAGAWNGVSSFAVFAVGYVVTMPLWLIPPLTLIVPWLWWSWLTARVMRFDSLADHATPDERAVLVDRDRGRYLLLGMAVSLLNLVPPLFLVAPVYGALAFAHYSLGALRRQRARERPVPARTTMPVAAARRG